MNTKRNIPYTSDDLRRIADRMDEILSVVGDEDLPDNDWRWGLSVTIFDEFGSAVGHLGAQGDGWIGFYPMAVMP